MAWTKRRKHLSRAARAQARERCEQRKWQRRRTPAAGEMMPERRVPWRRDLEFLATSGVSRQWPEDQERFRAILAAALDWRPGLVDEPYHAGLWVLAGQEWQRDPAGWRPRGRGLGEAFRSLAEHLHGHHRVPPRLWDGLLICNWSGYAGGLLLRFVSRVSAGDSPRRLVGTTVLPAPLTRRMTHLVLNPPRPLSLIAATRRAQVLGYGGPEWLAGKLLDAGLDEFLENEPYWATVIHWFCRQERLDQATYDELVTHLFIMLRECEPVAISGRTPKSLLRDRKRWLKARNEAVRQEESMCWSQCEPAPPCDIADYEEGEWKIARIRTGRKLIMEGAAMRHCIGTYVAEQKSGHRTFWSVTRSGRRALTLEAVAGTREVVSIAGRCNRNARRRELVPIRAWARQNGLTIGAWLEE